MNAKSIAIQAVISYGTLFFTGYRNRDVLEDLVYNSLTSEKGRQFLDAQEVTITLKRVVGQINEWQKRLDGGESITDFVWSNDEPCLG